MASAMRALALISGGERYDVILCDLMMPEMTGMDFYEALGRLNATLSHAVVFMSGCAFTSDARGFLKGVRNQLIKKPFDLFKLRSLVNHFVHAS